MKNLVIKWNNKWPWDYIWRKKYNIAFNSPEHNCMSPLDIRMDLLEDQMVQEQIRANKLQQDDLDHYKKTGSWWKSSEEIGDKPSLEMDDKLFDDIDIDDLNG